MKGIQLKIGVILATLILLVMIGANSKTCRQEINYPLSTLMLRTFSIENHRNHEHSVLKFSALKKNLNPLRTSINIKGTPSSSPLVQVKTPQGQPCYKSNLWQNANKTAKTALPS